MTPEQIIAAYERHEDAAGGIAKADPKECLRLAAKECGVSYGVARAAMIEDLAGTMRVG